MPPKPSLSSFAVAVIFRAWRKWTSAIAVNRTIAPSFRMEPSLSGSPLTGLKLKYFEEDIGCAPPPLKEESSHRSVKTDAALRSTSTQRVRKDGRSEGWSL